MEVNFQSNFNHYQITPMNWPQQQVDVQIEKSEAPPPGVSEPGGASLLRLHFRTPCFAATGKRNRELPLSKTKLA